MASREHLVGHFLKQNAGLDGLFGLLQKDSSDVLLHFQLFDIWQPGSIVSYPSKCCSLSFQLRRVFGKGVPSFPPKFYLAMTKTMADERRGQLEQYLQNGITNTLFYVFKPVIAFVVIQMFMVTVL